MFEIVGKEKFLKIVDMYGGFMVYIPTGKSIRRGSRNREIIKKYNGKNAVTSLHRYHDLEIFWIYSGLSEVNFLLY